MPRKGLIIFQTAVILAFALAFAHPARAGALRIDPSFRFSTIETAHFRVHYHDEVKPLAEKAALYAEEAHCALTSALKWSPEEKTHIVLVDSSDFANGMATVIPYNAIWLYASVPMAESTLGRYEEWLRQVIVHEYSHVLTMDPVRGYSRIARSIFGKPIPGADPLSFLAFIATVPPNVLLPNWWLEGASVWAETEFSPYGRGRATAYETIFRMAVAEDNLPTIDKINGEIPYWPDGNMPYIFGLALHRYIADKYGPDAIGKLSASHSSRFPYFISAPAQKLAGMDYAGIYNAMIAEMKKEQALKIGVLNSAAFTNSATLPLEGEILSNPRQSRDGKLLAYNYYDPHGHDEIVIADTSFKKFASVRTLPSDGNIAWSSDNSRIYFAQAEFAGFKFYQDLYEYDLITKKTARLTKDKRVKDPDVSPDGKTFAVAINEGFKQSLSAIVINGTGAIINTLEAFDGGRVSTPKWSPDGKSIAYSLKDSRRGTSIRIYDIASRSSKALIEDEYDNLSPAWSPDAASVIYSSDKTGVYNLYAIPASGGAPKQITHVLGGAFEPEVTREKIYFVSYNSRGFKISEMPYEPGAWTEAFSPLIAPSWPGLRNATGFANTSGFTNAISACSEDAAKAVSRGEPGKTLSPIKYSPLGSLIPRFWLPTIKYDDEGAVLGAFTAGMDVLGYHTYIAEASIGQGGSGYYDLTYEYEQFYPSVVLRAFRRPVIYRNFFGDDHLYERQSGLTASVSYPVILKKELRAELTAGWNGLSQSQLSGPYRVFEGERDNLFARAAFKNTLRYPYSVSNEEGRIVTFTVKDYSKGRGSDVDSNEYIGTYQEFIGLGAHSVLALDIKAASSEGDRITQQAFQMGGTNVENENFPLRGYPSRFRSGRYLTTASAEYRRPVSYILKGWKTKPIFYDRLHASVFADAGAVWSSSDTIHGRDVKVAAGGELRLDVTVGYKLSVTPALGLARGFSAGGETVLYFTIYTLL